MSSSRKYNHIVFWKTKREGQFLKSSLLTEEEIENVERSERGVKIRKNRSERIGWSFVKLTDEQLVEVRASSDNDPLSKFCPKDLLGRPGEAYTEGAAAGALSKGDKSKIIPMELGRYAGTFLNRLSGGRAAYTCKAAASCATEEEAIIKISAKKL